MSKFLQFIILGFGISTQACANGFFWQADRNDQTLYLLGSIHQANSNFYPLDTRIYDAIRRSDLVFLEVDDLGSASTAEYISEKAKLPPGILITDGLSENTIQRAVNFGNSAGIPFSLFKHTKPWYYSAFMTSMQLIKMGFLPQQGVDLHILQKATEMDIPISGFETSVEQIDMLDSLGFDEKQVIQTLDELESAAELFTEMTSYWKAGNLEALSSQVDGGFAAYPEARAILLDHRNIKWMQKLDAAFDQNKTIFVVVGAAHLSGKNGLINLLENSNFTLRDPL